MNGTIYELPVVRVKLVTDGPPLLADHSIQSPEDAVSVLGSFIQDSANERLMMAGLDSSGKPIFASTVSIGGTSSTMLPIPEVMKNMLLSNCSSAIIIHNHPSGNLEPSMEDISSAVNLGEAMKLLGYQLLDSVIVNPKGEYCSLHENNLMLKESLRTGRPLITHQAYVGEEVAQYQAGADRVKALTEKLENSIKELTQSEKYRQWLDTAAKFYRYSWRNQLLIALQTEGKATLVNSYTRWKALGRQVSKGEKGIAIIAPVPYKKTVTDPNDPNKQVEIQRTYYKAEHVFDISQTTGEELQLKLAPDSIEGQIENIEALKAACAAASPCEIRYEDYPGESHGFFSHANGGQIVVQKNLTAAQSLSTVVHEMCHALLETSGRASKNHHAKEVEAQSVSYIVCKALAEQTGFQINSEEYSSAYVAGWSQSEDGLKELKDSLEVIQETSGELITAILEEYRKIIKKDGLKEKEDTYEIWQLKDTPECQELLFMPYDYCKAFRLTESRYEKKYEASLEKGTSLEDLYMKFNISRPEGFTGHSMSTSDVVVMKIDGKKTAWFVDEVGFQPVPGFCKPLTEGHNRGKGR